MEEKIKKKKKIIVMQWFQEEHDRIYPRIRFVSFRILEFKLYGLFASTTPSYIRFMDRTDVSG